MTVEYGGRTAKGNIFCEGSSPTITNAVIRHSSAYGIYRADGAAPTLSGLTYDNNASGDVF